MTVIVSQVSGTTVVQVSLTGQPQVDVSFGIAGPPGEPGSPDAVLSTPQTLSVGRQAQVRTNVKAAERLIPFLFPGALMTWTIVHNLSRPLPPFRALDSDGNQMIVSAEDQPGFNITVINFNSPQSGGVYFA